MTPCILASKKDGYFLSTIICTVQQEILMEGWTASVSNELNFDVNHGIIGF